MTAILSILIQFFVTFTQAHPGRASSDGCHFCRSNCKKHGLTENTRHPKRGVSAKNCNQSKGPIDPKYSPITSSRKNRSGKGVVLGKYNRKQWPHWIDRDGDCQNERHELLIKSSSTPVSFKNNKKCTVKKGRWVCAFSGQIFVNAKKLDIDHVIPLYFAHTHGGNKWTRTMRKKFANDPENLLVTESGLNRQKSAKPPWEWLPLKRYLACEYVKKWNYLLRKYPIELTKREKTLLSQAVTGC